MAEPGSRSFPTAGDPSRVAAPVSLRVVARPVAANDNRAPLARRLRAPMLLACLVAAALLGVYFLSV